MPPSLVPFSRPLERAAERRQEVAGAPGEQRRAAFMRILDEYGDVRVTLARGERRHAGAWASFMLGDEYAAELKIEAAFSQMVQLIREGKRPRPGQIGTGSRQSAPNMTCIL